LFTVFCILELDEYFVYIGSIGLPSKPALIFARCGYMHAHLVLCTDTLFWSCFLLHFTLSWIFICWPSSMVHMWQLVEYCKLSCKVR